MKKYLFFLVFFVLTWYSCAFSPSSNPDDIYYDTSVAKYYEMAEDTTLTDTIDTVKIQRNNRYRRYTY